MTSIIYKGIYLNHWSWQSVFDFYIARAKRIIPALAFLCAILLAIGFPLLFSSEYQQLSKQVISSLGFFSNIQFWQESGYFDTESHKKILLHTWSLSLEWQFYLIFPIVLIALNKIFKKQNIVNYFILFGLVASFAASCFFTYRFPEASFYLLPTRVWEFLVGGLVFIFFDTYHISEKFRKHVESIGIFMLVCSAIFIEQKNIWPGYGALAPVLGTFLVLVARGQSLLTHHALAQWLGKISYSLYLWHWPVVVMLVYMDWHGKIAPTFFALILSLLLGFLSWYFVENKSKYFLSKLSFKRAWMVLVFFAVLVASMAALVLLKTEFKSQRIQAVVNEKLNGNPLSTQCHVSGLKTVPECIYGNKNYGLIMIGDSHADALVRTVEKALEKKDMGVLDWSLSSCPTIAGIQRDESNYRCGEQVIDFLKKSSAMNNKAPIFIVNRITAYVEGLTESEMREGYQLKVSYTDERHKDDKVKRDQDLHHAMVKTACEFAKHRKVYMLRPIPEMDKNVPSFMEKEITEGREDSRVSISLDAYYARHQWALAAQDAAAQACGVSLLDPVPYLCSQGRCWGDHDGLPIYRDDDHLSERGAALLMPLFQQIAQELPSAL